MKEELRQKYLLIRKNIKSKDKKDKAIYNKVINNSKIKSSNLILIYVSKKEEVDTINIINYFLKSKQIAVPKIENNIMNFYYIKSLNDLKKGSFNVLEPITKDKVTDFNNCISITPGICFSKDNYRIGYGKGYYDKFYEDNNIYSIGLCYKECLLNKIPKDKGDIPVNEIITN